MKPKKQESSTCDDLFRLRLEQILDRRHVLYRLADNIDWNAVEERFGGLYAEAGRPGIPIRLMVGLHYLKHAFNELDETVVERWIKNPYWQHFCGEEYAIYSYQTYLLRNGALIDRILPPSKRWRKFNDA